VLLVPVLAVLVRLHCRVARPLIHFTTRFAKKIGAAISEAAMRPDPTWPYGSLMNSPSRAGPAAAPTPGGAAAHAPGVRPHRRSRNRGTEYVSDSGIKRMSGRATRQVRPSPARAVRAPRADEAPVAREHLRGEMKKGELRTLKEMKMVN
jgi:hypothetical protein